MKFRRETIKANDLIAPVLSLFTKRSKSPPAKGIKTKRVKIYSDIFISIVV